MAKELLPQLRMELKAVCPIDGATMNYETNASKLVTSGFDALSRYDSSCSKVREQADTIKREEEVTAQEAKKAATQKEKQVKAELSDAGKVNNEIGMPKLISHLIDNYKLTQVAAKAKLEHWSAFQMGAGRWHWKDGAGKRFTTYKAVAGALGYLPSPVSSKKRKQPANDTSPN